MSKKVVFQLPSTQLSDLQKLKGKRLVKWIRFGGSIQDATEYWVELFDYSPSKLFSVAGSFSTLLYFDDGTYLAAWTNYDQRSVVVAFPDEGQVQELLTDAEIIDALDSQYSEPVWSEFLHTTVENISLLKGIVHNAKYERYPLETGLAIKMSNGQTIAIGFGLYDDGEQCDIVLYDRIGAGSGGVDRIISDVINIF